MLVKNHQWLSWAREIQAITQTALGYTNNEFERERLIRIRTISYEMIVSNSNHTEQQVEELFNNQDGYATPKLGVRAVIFKDNKLLLVRDRIDSLWSPPGGFADVNITASECVIKEVYEETGLEVKVNKLIAVYDNRLHNHRQKIQHFYLLFFLCEEIGGKLRISNETDDVRYFAEHEIPALSTGKVTRDEIHRFFMHLHNPDLPTEFD